MNEQDYEYHGLVASSWDFLRGDTSGYADRLYFRELIHYNGEPALVVGCGTGRLLLEYAAAAIDVDGVDVSPEMLDICREKARQRALTVALYEQAMETLDLPRRYQTIIVPSSSFQLVTDLASARRALAAFERHLVPGGTVALSIWQVLSAGSATWGDWRLIAEKDGFEEGKALKRWERSRYDAQTQLRHTENRYELLNEQGQLLRTERHRRSPEMRSYSPSQLRSLMEEAGFSRVHAVSGLSNEPADEGDELFCIFGEKPGYFMFSKRLGFSHWREADFDLALGLWGDVRVTQLIDARGQLTEEQVSQKLQQEIKREAHYGVQYWPIFLLSTGEHIGCCGLRPYDLEQGIYEIGFHISPPYWRRGFASEAARRVITYAFDELGAQALFAGHNPRNTASRELLLKLGFQYTGDEYYPPTGLNHPSYLLREEG